jgi:hypothetical protein
MRNKNKVASFTVEIHRLPNGDFEPHFLEPESDPDTPYEMIKLSLLAAELREHMKEQCIICNVDYEKRMLLLSEKLVDHEGFYKNQKLRREVLDRVVPDVEKYQQPLPFKERTNEDVD